MRLIDADNATQEIKDEEKYLSDEEQYGLNTALRILRQAPTVNAVVLPCKLGDTVYVDRRTILAGFAPKGISTEIATGQVVSFRKNKQSTFAKIKFWFPSQVRSSSKSYVVSAFGKTVFLTPEAAEAALAERRADE